MPALERARVRKGIVLILLAMTSLIVLDACAKWLVMRGVTSIAVTWSRYFGHLVFVLLVFWPEHRLAVLKTAHPIRQLVRGALTVAVSLVYFEALKVIPLAQATAVFFLTPILVTLLSVLFLRERPGWPTWLAVGCGFLGVLIVVRPGTDLPLIGVLMIAAASAANAIYQTMTRAQAQADLPHVQVFYGGLVGAVILTVVMPFWWVPGWWAPLALTWFDWMIFLGLGVFGGLGHLLMARAFQHAQASRLTPWMYFQLLLSVTIGFLVFGNAPDAIALVGMVLIAASPNFARLRAR